MPSGVSSKQDPDRHSDPGFELRSFVSYCFSWCSIVGLLTIVATIDIDVVISLITFTNKGSHSSFEALALKQNAQTLIPKSISLSTLENESCSPKPCAARAQGLMVSIRTRIAGISTNKDTSTEVAFYFIHWWGGASIAGERLGGFRYAGSSLGVPAVS